MFGEINMFNNQLIITLLNAVAKQTLV